MTRALTIGQIAKTTGVAAKTIRYYEQVGVLPTPSRTAAGYRQYDQLGLQRLRLVGRARALGLPLRDLKTLIATLDGRPRPTLRPRLVAVVRAQLAAVQHQTAELHVLERQLEQVLHRLLILRPERDTRGCRCLDIEGGGRDLSAH